MIVERSTFYAKYGQGDALVELIREFVNGVGKPYTKGTPRVFVDATGAMFRVIWDWEYADLNELATIVAARNAAFSQPAVQAWFAKMQPLVERGERELLQTVAL